MHKNSATRLCPKIIPRTTKCKVGMSPTIPQGYAVWEKDWHDVWSKWEATQNQCALSITQHVLKHVQALFQSLTTIALSKKCRGGSRTWQPLCSQPCTSIAQRPASVTLSNHVQASLWSSTTLEASNRAEALSNTYTCGSGWSCLIRIPRSMMFEIRMCPTIIQSYVVWDKDWDDVWSNWGATRDQYALGMSCHMLSNMHKRCSREGQTQRCQLRVLT